MCGARTSLADHEYQCLAGPIQASSPEEYLSGIVTNIDSCKELWKNNKKYHNMLRCTIIVGAALVTALINIPGIPSVIPTLLSAIVAVAAGLSGYYRFDERGHQLFLTSAKMAEEYNHFQLHQAEYKGLESGPAFEVFMERTNAILNEQRANLPTNGGEKHR